jgi:hypothetical protein
LNLAPAEEDKEDAQNVLFCFKNIDSAFLADPGQELTKVLTFRKKLENGRTILIRNFKSEVDFGLESDRHLRAFVRREWDALRADSPGIELSAVQVGCRTRETAPIGVKVERARSRQPKARSKPRQVIAAAKADLSLVKPFQEDLAPTRAAVLRAAKERFRTLAFCSRRAAEGTTDLPILSLAEASPHYC